MEMMCRSAIHFLFSRPRSNLARRARSTTARATKRTREFESNMHAKQANPPGAAAQPFSSLSLLRTAVTGCVLALLATSFAACHRAPPRSTALSGAGTTTTAPLRGAESSMIAVRFLENRVKNDPDDMVALNKLASYYLQLYRETNDVAY